MKDSRQPILLMDYLRGEYIPKDSMWELFIQLVKKLSASSSLTDEKDSITKSSNIFVKDNPIFLKYEGEEIFYGNSLEILEGDKGLHYFVTGNKIHENLNAKNYVVNKNLSRALSLTRYDLDLKYVPQKFCGFISLADIFNKKYYGSIVFPLIANNERSLGVVSLCKEVVKEQVILVPSFQVFSLEMGKYSEMVKQLNSKFEKSLLTLSLDEEDYLYYRTILNAVIYISHTDKDLIEEVNQFATKTSKMQTEKKLYTSLPYIRVGINFQLPREYNVEWCMVSGHFKWQHHGPKNSLVKLIYVDPTVRHFDKEE